MRVLPICALLIGFAPLAAQCPLEPFGSPDPGHLELYGWDVDVSGNTAVVGAYLDDEAYAQAGAVYTLEFDGSRWLPDQKLMAPDPGYGDWLGSAVAIDGDTLVASAPGKRVNGMPDVGTVYVFRRQAGVWSLETRLDPASIEGNDQLGKTSIDVEGDHVLVGAWKHGPYSHERGLAFIFHRTSSGWTQQAELVSPDGSSSYRFGWAVDLDRGRAAITQPGPGYVGAAHLYRLIAGQWVHEVELVSNDAAPYQTMGRSVDLDGDTLVAGAPFDATHVDTGGSAVIFRLGTEGWYEEDRLYPPIPDVRAYFGWRVAVQGDRLIVGCWRESLTSTNQGAAYLYHRRNGTWKLRNRFEDPEGGAGDEFSGNLDIDGPHLLVGAAFFDDKGRVNPYLLSTPLAYCTSKVNSRDCLPTIGADGAAASLSSPFPLHVRAVNVINNQFGLLVVGDGAEDVPFQGGTLCVRRVPTRILPCFSNGTPYGVDCSGALTFDLNEALRTGLVGGFEVGEELFLQWWYRDPWDPTGHGLSDALRLHVCP